ncbi:MAG: mobile mystery protein A [Pyrinomonadaceae bacterium]
MDQKLEAFSAADKIQVPQKGWINHIRSTLNMTLKQLGKRLNMTEQGAKQIEEREVTGAITVKSLKEVSKAIDMRFVYGFVPINGSVEKLVEIRARELARRIVLRTNQNMRLENQGNSEERINQAINELANEIKSEMRRTLWD